MGAKSINDSSGYMGLVHRNYDYTTSNNIILSFSDVYEVQVIKKKRKEEKVKATTRITKTKRIKLIKREEEERKVITLLVVVRSKLE